MKTNWMCLAAALLFAACAPKVGNTTKIVGQFSDNTPKIVEVSMGLMADNDILDTTIVVENGRFEFEIPKNLTAPAVMRTGFSELTFLSDGSTITVDPEAGTAVSSNKKGPHARFVAYNEWMDQFTSDYRTKMAEFSEDEDAAEAYYEETMAAFNDYQKEAAKTNSDNIVGLYAITQLQMMPDNFDEIISRKHTGATKWEAGPNGMKLPEDIIPMWVADMDFPCAPPIVESLQKAADLRIYGYSQFPEGYYGQEQNFTLCIYG